MTTITETQHQSLVTKIYDSIMGQEDMGFGEMGEATDEANRIVNEWMEENSITII